MLILGTWLPEPPSLVKEGKCICKGTWLLGVFKGTYPFPSRGSRWCLALQPEQLCQKTLSWVDLPGSSSDNWCLCLNLHSFVSFSLYICWCCCLQGIFKFSFCGLLPFRPAVCTRASKRRCIYRESPMSAVKTANMWMCVLWERQTDTPVEAGVLKPRAVFCWITE